MQEGCRKAEDIRHVLQDRIAELPGTRDRNRRPVIVFPARECSAPVNPDHIRNILQYLHAVTADDYKEHGFVIVIDMRKGTTWNCVKPILKCIQEHFPSVVHAVLIIKPDKFWEKHKTSVSSGKYKFDVQMISVENLTRYIEPSQLTSDLGGSLYYDHDEWLETRLELEKIIWQTIEIMRNFEHYREEMRNGEMPVDVETAERATTAHIALKKKILGAPIEHIQNEAEKMHQRISGSGAVTPDDGYNSSNGILTTNPDLAAALPHLSSLVQTLRNSKEEVFMQWDSRRQKLDHCYQLKLFEQDAEKMFDWIRSHYALSTQNLLEIGDSEQSTSQLVAEHREFTKAAYNTEVNVSHVMSVATRLREIGNYGKMQIESVAMRLEEDWRKFKQINDQRTRLLELSLSFHRKSHMYLSNAPHWLHNIMMDIGNRMGNYSAEDLEAAIAEHEHFGEMFLQTYAEAIGDGRSLSQLLKSLAGDAVGQNSAYKHVVDVIQQITRTHKELHSQWQAKKLRLHSRLALIAFKTDTHRVLQWLEEHGDAYLTKNTAVGNNLAQAKVLQRNHTHFRSVATNTYSNAEKLFTASNTIIESGECDVQQMTAVVEELRRRIKMFSDKVEARRDLLNKAVLFHTHYNEIMEWYGRMETKSAEYVRVSTSIQECERRKEEWMVESDATAQAYATTLNDGEKLLKALEMQAQKMNIDNREAVAVIERLIGDIEQRHAKLADRWPQQRRALQLATKFATFIRECKQIIQQLKSWQEDMVALVKSENFVERAEHIMPYQEDNTAQVKAAVKEVSNKAVELSQALEGIEPNLVDEDGELASDVIVRNLQQLNDCQREVMQVAHETRHRIDQCIQFNRASALATVAVQQMQCEEQKLLRMNTIPATFEEALAAQVAHKHFQHILENINLKTRTFIEKTTQLVRSGGIDIEAVHELRERVLDRWRRLVGLAEERNKLIKAGVVCYKTLHQGVMPILDQLEKEYSTAAKDWCSFRSEDDAKDRAYYVSTLLSKHKEYKERFLKGCSYAQKTSEMFLKYIRRCETSPEHIRLHEKRLLALKADLRERQLKILDLWTRKKHQLDRCHEACLLEATAIENADWITYEGETFVNKCLERNPSECRRQILDAYLEEYATFKAEAKQKRAKVRVMLGLAERFSATRDHHCADIERRMEAVRTNFEKFSVRLANYESALYAAIGQKSDVNKAKDELSLDRRSDSNIEAKIESERLANEEMRKLREPMMELIKSEKDYIDDLKRCIHYYMHAYRDAQDSLPSSLRSKEKEIFSNVEQLFEFHNEVFLPQLLKYENEPEDVGYCFIFYVETLNSLYTEYCLNKEQNNHIIALPEAVQFFSEIRERNGLEHSQDLSSLVIKPVQRITRYRLMLEQLLKNCKKNVDEIREAYDVVVSVPRRANDLMHLENFEEHKKLGVLGEFVMQEAFIVWDPKAYFRKGRERQVFLFELCVVFAKKIELSSRTVKYVYKNHLMLAEINVCEHVEGDSSKFALRQGSTPNAERTELKATNEQGKVHWVKKIRELMRGLMTANVDLTQPGSRNSRTTTSSSDRTSKDSDSLPGSTEEQVVLRSCNSSSTNLEGRNEGCIAIDDFKATERGQLSVSKGQRLEVVECYTDAPDWVLVSITWENGERQQGLVPCSVISSVEVNDSVSASCSTDRPLTDPSSGAGLSQNIVKRKSLKRFFNNSQQQQQQQQASSDTNQTVQARPQSVALITRKGSSQPNRLSATDLIQPATPSSADTQDESSRVAAGETHSVLSSCDGQISSSIADPSSGPLTESPALIDPAVDPAASFSEQVEFELPPPMSDLSSAIADAASSRNASLEEQMGGDGGVEGADENGAPTEKTQKDPEDIARQKRQYVLMELVETERDYVRDLSSVVDGYMANLQTMELPEDLVGKDKIIFANIAQILDFHKTLFLKEIELCLDNYEAAGNAFVKYERRLHTYYVKYCQNKPKSDFLMAQDDFEEFFAETKQKLGHKIALCDLLIKPVQRIMKYQLLLKDILKYTERAHDKTDALEKALQVMHVVPKACDDMMQVGRLQNFDGNLSAQGKLIYQGTVAISDNAPSQPFKGKDRRIFLFEQSAIIADCIMPRKEFGNPTYIFKSQIMVNKMVLESSIPDEPLRFILKSSDPAQPNAFLAQANTVEEKEQWISKINSQLDQQKTLLAALVDPKRYQNQLAGAVNSMSLEDGSSEKKKPIFSRLTGKGKEGGPSTGAGSLQQNSSAPVLSPKHASTNKSSKLFGFGKKSNSSASSKSASGPLPEVPCGIMSTSFSALKNRQFSAHRGEKVRILGVERGYAEVEKEDGQKGHVPTYFIDLDDIPGESFADQIKYRRDWYSLMDNEECNSFDDNLSHFLNNIPLISPLTSFLPLQRPSTFPRDHKRPICLLSLEDLTVKEKQKFVLCSQFFSEEPYDITWRGPAIAAKRNFVVTHDEESITRLTVYDCGMEDMGQYWVQAENKFGKCHSVAWVNVIVPPGRTQFILVKPLSRDTLLLQWKPAKCGNSKNLRYNILYKFKGLYDFEMAQGALTDTSTMVTDLRPVKYEFRIYAHNEYFIGKASEVMEIDMSHAGYRSITPVGVDQNDFITKEVFEKRYKYGELISVGRSGKILVVMDTVSAKQYVAKIFKSRKGNDWNDIDRNLKICSNLRHPNIAATMVIVNTPEERIHIMQRVNGPPLFDYIIGLGYVSEALIRRFCKDLLSALQYLHSMQLAHLDIVPENLLTHTSKSVRLVLIDFESCRRCDSGTFVWNCDSIDFASPEQISHKQITTSSDMWSFGIILHILVSGRSPFENDSDEVLRLMILSSSSNSVFDGYDCLIYSPSLVRMLKGVIIQNESERLTATECLESDWIRGECSEELLLVDYLEDYKERRHTRRRTLSL